MEADIYFCQKNKIKQKKISVKIVLKNIKLMIFFLIRKKKRQIKLIIKKQKDSEGHYENRNQSGESTYKKNSLLTEIRKLSRNNNYPFIVIGMRIWGGEGWAR